MNNKAYYPYMDNLDGGGGLGSKPESGNTKSGIDELEKKLALLESANRNLKEQLRLKQDEIKNLESKIEELRFLYSQSEKSLGYYDKYFKTVGDVYSVARECADGIVKRAENKASDILSKLEGKVTEELEKSLQLSKKAHTRLVETLSVLISQLQITYNEINSLNTKIESVPDLIRPVLNSKQDLLDEIKGDVEDYHKRSLEIIAGAQRAEQAINIMDEKAGQKGEQDHSDSLGYDGSKSDRIMEPVIDKDIQAKTQNMSASRRRMTLLEQEKLRRKMDAESRKDKIEQPETVEEKTEEKGETMPKSDIISDSGEFIDRKRRASVKDILDKYRNHNF
ncbi:MAG TPA: hypothetical protein PLG48_01165 [Candidatus Avimonas sp.]|nr:hypothetical protein [Clostridiales bacterium]HPU58104.1 hypothetical protein [Candidatus Avimonas sp.]